MASVVPALSSEPAGSAASSRQWERLLTDAGQIHLPTTFLKVIPSDFIRFEFDDLRTYAAEYHPGEHRLVLNRALSFNAAGRVLKPLTKMTHKELEVLYHELFHAYMDYLASSVGESRDGVPVSSELMDFARMQQACRYENVMTAPVAQRPNETEPRYLTESESWEALNETWAVFVGWAIWNQLDVQHPGVDSMFRQQGLMERWAQRLQAAFQKGELRGYYVPDDIDERRITHKRFLAKPSQITWREAAVLMNQVLDFNDKSILFAQQIAGVLQGSAQSAPCRSISK
ncbi:MAG: hypothetical protein HP491_03680 [Nitrospira sp.]|nr:hypothetical protein [Nitrospira sp.]MBH0180941.1 hypothetical protein [Nitrospira sp.]MBH0185553.1 hypothetical protein [Nitrospira sp.]